ncbi:MAG: class I SAM-dependent methyltransferase [Solobacterium sp.]|nr:class I SAM-dependent methyltransferase [Solobacterium sp.]
MKKNRLIPKIAGETREDHIPLMLDESMELLLDYIETHEEIEKILEIGTAVGWSSMCMAGVRKTIHVDTVEIDLDMAEKAINNIRDNDLRDQITVHHIDALQYETGKIFDLIFIDAAKSQYMNYVDHFFDNSHTGTMFVFDNLNFHGIVDDPSLSHNRSTIQLTRKIREFREKLSGDPRFATQFMDIGDGIAFAERIV